MHTLVFASPGVAKTDVFLHPVKMQSNASRHLLKRHKEHKFFLSKEKEKGTMCRLSLTEGKDISIDNDITSIK